MSLVAQEKLQLKESETQFISKLSKIHDVKKLDTFMNDYGIQQGSDLKFKNSNDGLKFEHCVLLSGNSFLLRELVNRGDNFFTTYNSYGRGFSNIFKYMNSSHSEQEKIRHKEESNPKNFLINSYTNKTIGSFKAKDISKEFILTMMDLFPNELHVDSFFNIITTHYKEREIEESLKNQIIETFDSKLSYDGISPLISTLSYKNFYFGSKSVDLIEKNIPQIYDIKNSYYLSYIMGSPYNYEMINKLFNLHKSDEIFNSISRHSKNIGGYVTGTISQDSGLTFYHLNNNHHDKVRFILEQIKNAKSNAFDDEFSFILKQAICSYNDCSDILSLISKNYKDQNYDHFCIINYYFSEKLERNNDNLKNYITLFNLENVVFNEEQHHIIIHNIMSNKKQSIFSDFINSSLFNNDYFSIISEELGKSLSRKRTSTKENEKEIDFYIQVINTLQSKNIKISDDVKAFLDKHSVVSSKLKSLVEFHVLSENLNNNEHKPVIKKRL